MKTIDISSRLKKISEISLVPEKKEWVFNFTGGGWNSVFAYTKEEAIELAKAKYNDAHSQVDESSFRIPSKEEYDNLLRMFW